MSVLATNSATSPSHSLTHGSVSNRTAVVACGIGLVTPSAGGDANSGQWDSDSAATYCCPLASQIDCDACISFWNGSAEPTAVPGAVTAGVQHCLLAVVIPCLDDGIDVLMGSGGTSSPSVIVLACAIIGLAPSARSSVLPGQAVLRCFRHLSAPEKRCKSLSHHRCYDTTTFRRSAAINPRLTVLSRSAVVNFSMLRVSRVHLASKVATFALWNSTFVFNARPSSMDRCSASSHACSLSFTSCYHIQVCWTW